MLLDLGKAIAFLASLFTLYRVVVSAFFATARWHDRFWLMLPDTAVAVCVCLAAGMVFRWPARTNPEAGKPLASSLPVQMMFWTVPAITILFSVSWYLFCGNPLQPTPWCR